MEASGPPVSVRERWPVSQLWNLSRLSPSFSEDVEGFDSPAAISELLWGGASTPSTKMDRVHGLKGFPQGCNYSAFLSVMALAASGSPKFASILMYADDGLFYADHSISVSEIKSFFRSLGLTLADGKCGFVKRAGA